MIVKFSIFVLFLAFSTYCNVIYDGKLVPDLCLKTRAIEGDYIPRGSITYMGNLPIYEAPHLDNRRLLIAVYDIFGFTSTNMKQVTDQVALQNNGFRAVLPDFFRGDHWNITESPPETIEEWLQRIADWDTVIKPDLINIVQHYQRLGVEEFAIFGMCWGGQIGTLSAIELSSYFKASAIVHPAFITNDLAEYVRIPMYLMPTGGGFDMLPFYSVLRRNFGDNSGHRRFDDMQHGFAAARGNFSDPVIQMNVNEVIRIMGTFFERNLQR